MGNFVWLMRTNSTTNYSSCSPTNDLFSQVQIVTMLHQPHFEWDRWIFCCCCCHFDFIHLCNCTQFQNVLFARKHDNIFLDLPVFSSNVAREGFSIRNKDLIPLPWIYNFVFRSEFSQFGPQYLLLNSVVHLKSISFGMNTNESSTWLGSFLSLFHSSLFWLVRLSFGILRIANGETIVQKQFKISNIKWNCCCCFFFEFDVEHSFTLFDERTGIEHGKATRIELCFNFYTKEA